MTDAAHDEPVSDAALIAQSLAEPERFALIFDRHAPHLQRYLARRLGREQAEDLLAEVFLAGFRRRARYDVNRQDVRPWLFGIAAKAVAQHHRSESRRFRLLASVQAAPDEPNHAEAVSERVTAQAARRALAAALAELKRADREVLLLIAWEQLSYEETASVLAIPIGTVRSRMHRARRQIRAQLDGLDPREATDTTLQELLTHE